MSFRETVAGPRRHLGMQPTPYSYPSQFPSAPQRRSIPPVKRAGRRMAILAGAIIGGLALVVGGIYIYFTITPQNHVLVDNGNAFAVQVEVGGTTLSLAPRTSTEIRVHDGTLTATATGPNGFRETVTLELPDTGWRRGGRTAVYNVGGASKLAIISMTYGTVAGNQTPPFVPLAPTPKLVLLPPGSFGKIDEAFPSAVSTKSWGVLLRRVCHVDADGRFGCHGANDGE